MDISLVKRSTTRQTELREAVWRLEQARTARSELSNIGFRTDAKTQLVPYRRPDPEFLAVMFKISAMSSQV